MLIYDIDCNWTYFINASSGSGWSLQGEDSLPVPVSCLMEATGTTCALGEGQGGGGGNSSWPIFQ